MSGGGSSGAGGGSVVDGVLDEGNRTATYVVDMDKSLPRLRIVHLVAPVSGAWQVLVTFTNITPGASVKAIMKAPADWPEGDNMSIRFDDAAFLGFGLLIGPEMVNDKSSANDFFFDATSFGTTVEDVVINATVQGREG